jgi:cell division initiation protein
MFRVNYRSFLDAQISLLDGQEEEVLELMGNWGTGWLEAAAGRADDNAGKSGGGVGIGADKTVAVSQAEPGIAGGGGGAGEEDGDK